LLRARFAGAGKSYDKSLRHPRRGFLGPRLRRGESPRSGSFEPLARRMLLRLWRVL